MPGIPIRPDIRPFGANGTVLIADSTQRNGTRWRTLTNTDVQTAFAINTFSIITPTACLIGGATTPQFTMSYNGTPSGATISLDNGTPQAIASPFTSFTSTTGTRYTTPTDVTCVLVASGMNGTAVATGYIYFRQMQWWGTAASGGISPTGINKLQNSGWATQESLIFTSTATSGNYQFYGFRNSTNTVQFASVDCGLCGGFLLTGSGNFVNSSGITESYRLWQSDQQGVSGMIFTVQSTLGTNFDIPIGPP